MNIKAVMLLTTIQNWFSIFENGAWGEVEGMKHTWARWENIVHLHRVKDNPREAKWETALI